MSQSIFFTSDNHYYHNNIIKYCNRPFSSVDEMNEQLIENHNIIIKNNDVIYMLGDFIFSNFGNAKTILKRLNGVKHFIHGNHDDVIIKNSSYFLNSKTFESISSYKEISINKNHINLFHYGCRVWNKSHHGSWLLYGHSHGNLPPYGKSVDVGVDSKFITEEYRPVSYEEIEKFMVSREIE